MEDLAAYQQYTSLSLIKISIPVHSHSDLYAVCNTKQIQVVIIIAKLCWYNNSILQLQFPCIDCICILRLAP